MHRHNGIVSVLIAIVSLLLSGAGVVSFPSVSVAAAVTPIVTPSTSPALALDAPDPAAGGSGTQFTSEGAPVRICDTRPGNPSGLSGLYDQCDGETIGPGSTLSVKVAGLGGVPASGASAVVVNLTAVAPTAPTYLTVFPGPTLPLVSDLNPAAGAVKGNLTVATLNANGTISIYNDAGDTNVVVDVLGWYS